MKNLLYIFIFLTGSILFAQTGNEETLFGSNDLRSGGYVAPELKVIQLKLNNNSQYGVMGGIKGGWIINSTFSIGLGGYFLLSNIPAFNAATPSLITLGDTTVYLRFGYGGLFLEYIMASDKMLHFTVNALIGAGGASYTNYDFSLTANNYWTHQTSSFFILEPGATADLNISRYFRLSAGIGYRIITGLDIPEIISIGTNTTASLSNSAMSGLSFNLAFKFGKF